MIERLLKGKTNRAEIPLSDKMLVEFINCCTAALIEIDEGTNEDIDTPILVVVPASRWKRIESKVDPKYVCHMGTVSPRLLQGYRFSVAFVDILLDRTPRAWQTHTVGLSTVLPIGAITDIRCVDNAVNFGIMRIRQLSKAPIKRPIGMRLMV